MGSDRGRIVIAVKDRGTEKARREVLARDVEVANTWLSKAVGLNFRRSVPDNHALVMAFSSRRSVALYMLFVPFDIDVLLLNSANVVTRKKTLKRITGFVRGSAETVIELPSGAADWVDVGDSIEFGWGETELG